MNELKQLLKDHQVGMSEFQDLYFVTAKTGGTLYGQYLQALREVYKRFRGLRQQISDHKRLLVDLDEAKYNSENEDLSEFDRRRAYIDYLEKSALQEESLRAVDATKREFITFYKQAVYLKSKIGELTKEKREKLERDMWLFKAKEQVCIDLVSRGRLSNNTYEMLHALPKDIKLKALDDIKDSNKLLSWYENREECYIPENLDYIEIPKNIRELKLCDNISLM